MFATCQSPVFVQSFEALRIVRKSSVDRVRRFMNRGRIRVTSSAVVARRLPRLKVAFQLPFRVRFGQSLKLVGSGFLGEWDLQRSVPMTWSDGDIWKAELEVDLNPDEILQYKYIVSNADGEVDAWKPGDNVCLSIPREGFRQDQGTVVRILDTWDGSIHEVELEQETSNSIHRDDDFIQSSLTKSYEDLERKLNSAQNLLERLDDPGAKELILADRELAVAAKKAHAMTKVMEATNQQSHLDEAH